MKNSEKGLEVPSQETSEIEVQPIKPESKENIETVEFSIMDQMQAFPDWELDDEAVEKAVKKWVGKEEIDVLSWKKIGVDIKNGVKWWGIEVKYSDK